MRTGLAFISALIIHLCFFWINLNSESQQAPEILGQHEIAVTLCSAPEPEQIPVPEKNKPEKAVPEQVIHRFHMVVPKEDSFQEINNEFKPFERDYIPVQHQESPPEKTEPKENVETVASVPLQTEIFKAKPIYHKNPRPIYPSIARKRGWQGVTTLAVTVDTAGKVTQAKIHESSGYTILDKSALKAIRRWSFAPGKVNGKATVMEVLVPVHFILREK